MNLLQNFEVLIMKSFVVFVVALLVSLVLVMSVRGVAIMLHEQHVAEAAAAKAAMGVRKDALNALTGKQRKVLRLTVAAAMGPLVREDDESCAMMLVSQAVGNTTVEGTLKDVYAGCGYTREDYLAYSIGVQMVKSQWRKQLLSQHQRR
jgi:hypothetical protein